MNLELGGPGPGCSAMRVRRLLAGELAGAEAERTLLHVEGCARCGQVQRELLLEQEALRRDVPFPAFAAGVAEKLAVRPRRSRLSRWAPMAAAAGVVLAASVLALRPSDTETVRSKGAATAQLFVQDRAGTRELSAGEPYYSCKNRGLRTTSLVLLLAWAFSSKMRDQIPATGHPATD